MTAADSSISRSATNRGLKSTSAPHRVVARVLDATHENDVRGAHRDLASSRGRCGERAGAHAIDGETRNGRRESCEQRDVAPERESRCPRPARLRRRRRRRHARKLRVAPKQLANGLHGHVVGARSRRTRPPSRDRRPCARRRHTPPREARARRDDTSDVTADWRTRRQSRRALRGRGGTLPEDADERQRQLTRMGNAAWAAWSLACSASARTQLRGQRGRLTRIERAGRARRPEAGAGRSGP